MAAETTNVTGLSAEDAARARAAGETVLPTASAADWLRHTPVSALLAAGGAATGRVLVSAPSDATVADVFMLLGREGISAVPLEAEKQLPGMPSHDVFVDTLDVVAALVGKHSAEDLAPGKIEGALAAACGPARAIAGAGGRSAFYPVEESAPLKQAVELLVEHKCRRLPILGAGSADVKALVTQSNFVKLFEENSGRFGDLNAKTVGELKLGYTDTMYTVKEDQPAVDAFRLMHEHRVSAVAVVDDKGALVGNISATDVRLLGVGSTTFQRLFLSAADFTALVLGRAIQAGREISGPIAVNPATTFEEVVAKVVMTNAHRLWVVDPTDGAKLLGVVSIVDLLKAVLDAANTKK